MIDFYGILVDSMGMENTFAGRWEHFEHQADMGVRGVGETCDQAFEQAAMALTAVMLDPAEVRTETQVEVKCDAGDLEMLLVDWLSAIIFEMSSRKMIFGRFEVKIVGTSLSGMLWGEAVDQVRHAPAVEIKGATYTALFVRKDKAGIWTAQCVVDV